MSTGRRVGLIRGVNVGGKNRLPVADLRAFLERLGLADVQTYLQSGNFVFSDPRDPEELEGLLQARSTTELGLDTLYWVRTAAQWERLVASNPYPDAAEEVPNRLHAFVPRGELDETALAAAAARYGTTEQFQVADGNLYVFCPDGMGSSALLNSSPWVRATARTTARNWNTVLALAALAANQC